MIRRHDQIPEIALDWARSGRGAALATVIETWGSAPRQAGSQMVISGQGEIMGSVSGGCVEGAVVHEALAAMAAGEARELRYGVSDETAFTAGLACGGSIRLLVEPVAPGAMPEPLLAELVAAREARAPRAYVVNLARGERSLIAPEAADDALLARLRGDQSGEDDDRIVVIHNPALRLIVVGAVHIAQALLPMARLAGYDAVLIDPRAAFGSENRFPGEVIVDDWPDEAMAALAPDSRTAVVTLTHDEKLDDPAIRAALASPCFYLGCLGSARTHSKRVERLSAAGVSAADLARIHAPVGLNIGAKTPAEIAISVLAQITERLRRG